MAFGVSRLQYGFSDLIGTSAKTEVYLVAQAGTVTIATVEPMLTTLGLDLANISNAKLNSQAIRLEEPTTPGNGLAVVFPSATDKAVLVFGCANGQEVRVAIPAPNEGVFDTNSETVNAAQGNISSLITLLTNGNYCANSGSLITSYIRGFRSLRTREKR